MSAKNNTLPGADLQKLPVATAKKSWRTVVRASRGHRLKLLGVVVIGLGSSLFGLVTPAILGRLVDDATAGTATGASLLIMTLVMILAAVLGAVGTGLTAILAARSYQAMLAQLREELVERAMELPQHEVEKAGTGDLISRTSDDVTAIADAAPQIIPVFTRAVFTIIVTLGGIAALDWRYALVLVCSIPIWYATMRWYLRTGPRVYMAERTAMSVRAQHMNESVRGFSTIAGFNLADERTRNVLDSSWGVAEHAVRARTVQNMFFARLKFAEFVGMAGILIIGYWLIDQDAATIGSATTAMLFFMRLFGPVNQLLLVIDVLQSALASLNRIVGVITIPRQPRTSFPSEDPAVIAQVKNVTHRYDDNAPAALDSVSLDIHPGEHIAVVGASGAGKTTLAAVIAGIHEPQHGTVSRPEKITVITQEAHVFAGTLRENLNLAAPDATDEHIIAALEAISASSLVEVLPQGLNTHLGGLGRELTAAQAQQVALARLVLADPVLAILDEATAEAGSAHAGLLDRAADVALKGRTGLIIAHRLSQAAECDRIIVMDQGHIVESGTHEQLLEQDGTYARLWAAWSAS